MGLALSGLASGFDWKSLVDQLIETSRAPQNRMRREQSANATKTTALNEVKTLLSSLKSSLTPLSSTEAIQKKAATFADSSTTWTASANSDASAGIHKFEFISEATAAKLTGGAGVAKKLDHANPRGAVNTPLSSLPIGRTITGGIFTVNGVQIHKGLDGNGDPIPFTTADSLSTVLGRISSLSGVSASYNSGTDKIVLQKLDPGTGLPTAGQISLGASNDTSNFLQAMRLSSGSSPVSSSTTLSSPILTNSIDQANLSGWTGANVSGSIIINGVGIPYNSGNSLQSLLNDINNSSAGVLASYDASQGKFVLTNKNTGNVGITIQDGGSEGLTSALGFSSGILTPGQDAAFKYNDGAQIIYSQSNALGELAHGVTGLTVTAKYDSANLANNTQTITIGSDTSAIKEAINSFVEKYNAVQNAIDKYTKVTVSGTKVTSAVLAGNRELASISRDLRRMLYIGGLDASDVELSGTVKRISDLGVGFSGIENTISITNSSLLATRLDTNPDDVIDYLATAENGLAARLDSMLGRLVNDSTTDSASGAKITGAFKVQLDSITKQNTSLDKQIEEFERRLTSQRALLESSFIAMEKAQSGFQQQSSYLQKTFSGSSK